jgi:hypothetical protein
MTSSSVEISSAIAANFPASSKRPWLQIATAR